MSSKTNDITAKLLPSIDAKPFSPYVTKICETKSIANLKPFGEDRTVFRLWHDKLINAISQHVTGCRGLFAEMKSQLTTNKNGLTHTEWKFMWDNYVAETRMTDIDAMPQGDPFWSTGTQRIAHEIWFTAVILIAGSLSEARRDETGDTTPGGRQRLAGL